MHNAYVLVAPKQFVIDRVIKVTHNKTGCSICMKENQSVCKRRQGSKCGTQTILFLEGTLKRFCCITNEQTQHPPLQYQMPVFHSVV